MCLKETKAGEQWHDILLMMRVYEAHEHIEDDPLKEIE